MGRLIALAVLAALLAGCASTRTGSLCTVGPFRPDAGASERWTDNEKDQLIVLNDSGERVCGWKP
jgi:hypothetical protein